MTLIMAFAYLVIGPLSLTSSPSNLDKSSFRSLESRPRLQINERVQENKEQVTPPDAVSDLSFERDKPRLDYFARKLKKDRDGMLYVFVYGGRVGVKDEANRRVACVREYFIRRHRLTPRRIVVRNGGYRERITVEIFYRWRGQPIPSSAPTVDPHDVQVKKGKRKHNC